MLITRERVCLGALQTMSGFVALEQRSRSRTWHRNHLQDLLRHSLLRSVFVVSEYEIWAGPTVWSLNEFPAAPAAGGLHLGNPHTRQDSPGYFQVCLSQLPTSRTRGQSRLIHILCPPLLQIIWRQLPGAVF